MKFLAISLVALSLFGLSHAACNTKSWGPCLEASKRNPGQKSMTGDNDYCFWNTYKNANKWSCFYEEGTYYVDECTCEPGCNCPADAASGASEPKVDVDGECMAGGKRCLRADEVSNYFYDKFVTGNGNPCFKRNGKDTCINKQDDAGYIYFGDCNCDVKKCGCGSPPASQCPEGVKPDHNCNRKTLRKYRNKYGNDHTIGKKSTCGKFPAACGQVCNSGRITEAEEKAILKAHNDLRRKVAKGLETTSTAGSAKQPAAQDMNELIWDDELAEAAQRWSDECEGYHDTNEQRMMLTMDKYVGQNMYGAMTTKRNFADAVNAWYSEVAFFPSANTGALSQDGVPLNKKTGKKEATGHYTAVVWGETTRVGCGITSFKKAGSSDYTQRIMCNYWPAANLPGAPVYTIAEKDDDICALCTTSCNDGLCAPAATTAK